MVRRWIDNQRCPGEIKCENLSPQEEDCIKNVSGLIKTLAKIHKDVSGTGSFS